MSKTFEHYQGAARHHERAAYQFKEAAKYHETEEHEKEAHHAYLARGHAQHALVHEVAAAKLLNFACRCKHSRIRSASVFSRSPHCSAHECRGG